ncbi:MAG TPA: hypothetical protein VMX55_06110 [candidate division Zixibacteria bacterium]|nr:hypothetical protein [candidate division Zixibacteria bacterium]
MRNRIDILKNIMELEKQYALEEIDSEAFENSLVLYEQQLVEAQELTEEELKQAIDKKEIPLSANRLVGIISIEELLPNFNLPRTFFRHLKIQREIQELHRNIGKINHDLNKIKILLAEKKISQDSATNKIETLEFDLRLAQNRLGAREKYLNRNPTKGDLLKFTLENFLKFSFGHGISNDTELLVLSEDLKEEIVLRNNYRNALAELLATIKTSQIDLRSTKSEELPDFKKLRDLQHIINELQDYIKLLTDEVNVYSSCLKKLEKDFLELDESHQLFIPDKFGIDVLDKETIAEEIAEEIPENNVIDPLIQSLELEDSSSEGIFFLIDTLDIAEELDENNKTVKFEEIDTSLYVPEAPQPIYQPKIDLEIVGMEDFDSPFDIIGQHKRMNELTEQVIYQSFEKFITSLLDERNDEIKTDSVVEETPKPQLKARPQTVQAKVTFKSLSDEVKKIKGKEIPQPPKSITPSLIEAEEIIDEEFQEINEIEEMDTSGSELVQETEMITTKTESKEELTIEQTELPVIPDIDESKIPPIDTSLPVPPPPPSEEQPEAKVTETIRKEISEEDLIKPQKTTMVSQKLVEAATEAWKLTGKALFNLKEDGEREFLGYLQEVIVFNNNQLGFTLVSETIANQTIIDKIFDQIKPLWVTEDFLESPQKRKVYVIQEVVDSLQIQKDVALHISKLQEFTNFRNINYPIEENTSPQEILGIVPLNKLRIKRGSVICDINDLLSLIPFRSAPWAGKISDEEENSPISKSCYLHHGVKVGEIISIINHPLMGQILLLDTCEPDKSLIDYLVQRLEINEEDHKERIWLVKYLIAKQLRIPEGEALKAKTLIAYSLQRGFPILPNEILNSFRMFISGGSIDEIKRNNVILKNSARIFHPSEIIPIECLRIRSTQGRHIGTCIGVSLSDKPVLLVSERLSRDIVALFSDANIEKQIMSDISDSVMGSIGVDLRDSLCPHNILKTLIVGRKIQTLAEYGKFLSKLNVSGIDLSRIQVVEKGTVYIATLDTFVNSNIFDR